MSTRLNLRWAYNVRVVYKEQPNIGVSVCLKLVYFVWLSVTVCFSLCARLVTNQCRCVSCRVCVLVCLRTSVFSFQNRSRTRGGKAGILADDELFWLTFEKEKWVYASVWKKMVQNGWIRGFSFHIARKARDLELECGMKSWCQVFLILWSSLIWNRMRLSKLTLLCDVLLSRCVDNHVNFKTEY